MTRALAPIAASSTPSVSASPFEPSALPFSVARISFRSVLFAQEPLAPHTNKPDTRARPPHSTSTLRAFAPLLHSTADLESGKKETAASALGTRRRHDKEQDDFLDARNRHSAAVAPSDTIANSSLFAMHTGPTGHVPSVSASTVRAALSLEDLIPALVRRIAWSGDRQRGTVRLELGAGELAGATLLVHAEGKQVRVHMEVPAGVDTNRWQERIRGRLASRGIQIDAVEVT